MSGDNQPVLSVTDLRVRFDTDDGPLLAVDGMSFDVSPGEVLAIVGESGCGKSMTALSVLGLQPASARVTGSIRLAGREILGLPSRAMRSIRGSEIAMVFQEPMSSLNPVFKIGRQIAEVLRQHEKISARAARARSVELLELVRVPTPDRVVDEYPHQLSGGMQQRVMIAMAVACGPKVIIADEPTTSLDVTIQAQVLEIFRRLRDRTSTAIILITHDLGVVADIADSVVVMYAGHKMEQAPVMELFEHPRHPYTKGLLGTVPRTGLTGTRHELVEIPGTVPMIRSAPTECVFADRCGYAQEDCRAVSPGLRPIGTAAAVACLHPVVAAVRS